MKGPTPRTRSTDDVILTGTNVSTYWRKRSNGTYSSGPTVTSSSANAPQGMKAVMNDIVTPDFASAIAKGAIINNPMYRLEEHFTPGTVTSVYEALLSANQETTHTDTSYVGAVTGHLPLDIDLVALQQEAVTAAWAKVNGPEWWAGVDLGELAETVGMLGSPLRGISEILHNPCRNNLHHYMFIGGKLQKLSCRGYKVFDLSKLWLGYHLGLAPLFGSFEDAVKMLQKEFVERKTARSQRLATSTSEQEWVTNSFSSSGHTVTWKGRYVTDTKAVARAGVLYEPKPASVWRDLGLSGDQALPTLWELIPFSFIVDRFINVGNALQAMGQSLSMQPLASWCVLRLYQRTFNTYEGGTAVPLTGYVSKKVQHPYGNYGSLYSEKVIRSTHIKPGLVWRPSQYDFGAKLAHALDYASLASLALGRKYQNRQQGWGNTPYRTPGG